MLMWLKHFAAVVIACFLTSFVSAQVLSDVLRNDWSGFAKFYSDAYPGGKALARVEMKEVTTNSVKDSFTAVMTSRIEYKGKMYSTKVSVTGSFNNAQRSVSINYAGTISADPLPDGLTWTYSNLKGYLKTREGYRAYEITGTEEDGSKSFILKNTSFNY